MIVVGLVSMCWSDATAFCKNHKSKMPEVKTMWNF